MSFIHCAPSPSTLSLEFALALNPSYIYLYIARTSKFIYIIYSSKILITISSFTPLSTNRGSNPVLIALPAEMAGMTLESRLVSYDWKNQFDSFQQVTRQGSFKAICWDAKNTLIPVSSTQTPHIFVFNPSHPSHPLIIPPHSIMYEYYIYFIVAARTILPHFYVYTYRIYRTLFILITSETCKSLLFNWCYDVNVCRYSVLYNATGYEYTKYKRRIHASNGPFVFSQNTSFCLEFFFFFFFLFPSRSLDCSALAIYNMLSSCFELNIALLINYYKNWNERRLVYITISVILQVILYAITYEAKYKFKTKIKFKKIRKIALTEKRPFGKNIFVCKKKK